MRSAAITLWLITSAYGYTFQDAQFVGTKCKPIMGYIQSDVHTNLKPQAVNRVFPYSNEAVTEWTYTIPAHDASPEAREKGKKVVAFPDGTKKTIQTVAAITPQSQVFYRFQDRSAPALNNLPVCHIRIQHSGFSAQEDSDIEQQIVKTLSAKFPDSRRQ